MTQKTKKPISVRTNLVPALYDRLNREAHGELRTKSNMLTVLVTEALDARDRARAEDARLALEDAKDERETQRDALDVGVQ